LTKFFPKEEMYVLVTQIRRASISITSNLAEGNARFGQKDKLRFYNIAYSSLTELHNQILISRALKYLENSKMIVVKNQIVLPKKLINGLINKTRSFYPPITNH
jgi:four helix bundle protein